MGSEQSGGSRVRASIITGWELTKFDVAATKSKREKETGDSQDADEGRAKCTTVTALSIQLAHITVLHLISIGSTTTTADVEFLAARTWAYP